MPAKDSYYIAGAATAMLVPVMDHARAGLELVCRQVEADNGVGAADRVVQVPTADVYL